MVRMRPVPLFTELPRETVRKGAGVASGSLLFWLPEQLTGLFRPLSWTSEASARHLSGLFGRFLWSFLGNSRTEVLVDHLCRALGEPRYADTPVQPGDHVGLFVFRYVLRSRYALHGRAQRLGKGLGGVMQHPYRFHALVGQVL